MKYAIDFVFYKKCIPGGCGAFLIDLVETALSFDIGTRFRSGYLSSWEGWVLKSNFFSFHFFEKKKVRFPKAIYVGEEVIARGFPLSIVRASFRCRLG